jgi:hypothetical protein
MILSNIRPLAGRAWPVDAIIDTKKLLSGPGPSR